MTKIVKRIKLKHKYTRFYYAYFFISRNNFSYWKISSNKYLAYLLDCNDYFNNHFFFNFKKIQIIPKGFQNIIEIIIENILKLVQGVTNNKKQTEKFFPLVATIFIFILSANWIGIFPGIGTIGFKENGIFIPFFVQLIRI